VEQLEFVRVSHNSMHGRIRSEWRRAASQFELNVTIPPNTTATVYLPARDASAVREGGEPVAQSDGLRFERAENGRAVYSVGSGSYAFTAPL
jgi:alpha-L-rhamnosidase